MVVRIYKAHKEGDEEDNKMRDEDEGLPSVLSGPLAFLIAKVYSLFIPMILQSDPLWVLFHPCSQR